MIVDFSIIASNFYLFSIEWFGLTAKKSFIKQCLILFVEQKKFQINLKMLDGRSSLTLFCVLLFRIARAIHECYFTNISLFGNRHFQAHYMRIFVMETPTFHTIFILFDLKHLRSIIIEQQTPIKHFDRSSGNKMSRKKNHVDSIVSGT